MRHTVNRSKVVLEHFDDETVLINMQTCVYYSLSPSGCEVWKLVEAGHDTAAVIANLARRHSTDEATVAAQVTALLAQLVEEGLIELSTATAAPAEPPPLPSPSSERPPFIEPRLSRYSDMQDLLLLDPIHDVDASGWPNSRPQATVGK